MIDNGIIWNHNDIRSYSTMSGNNNIGILFTAIIVKQSQSVAIIFWQRLVDLFLVGGIPTPLKNMSQLGLLFPIDGKIKNVSNHQPNVRFSWLNQHSCRLIFYPLHVFWLKTICLNCFPSQGSRDYTLLPLHSRFLGKHIFPGYSIYHIYVQASNVPTAFKLYPKYTTNILQIHVYTLW